MIDNSGKDTSLGDRRCGRPTTKWNFHVLRIERNLTEGEWSTIIGENAYFIKENSQIIKTEKDRYRISFFGD